MPGLDSWFIEGRGLIDGALAQALPPQEDAVSKAMHYSLFAGGKRLRPLLAVLTSESLGFDREATLPYACALEMVHTYSLIHDDLPAMDNDDLRRGRPTCHKVFGEATALLAGDALLTRAFELLGESYESLPAPRLARTLRAFGQALGMKGMVGGQSRDLAAEGKDIGLGDLQVIHQGKTGALISVSLVGVGHLAGAPAETMKVLAEYGDTLGLIFQIRDDILDVEGTAAVLGKTPGKDEASGKATYPRIVGMDGSRSLLADSVGQAERLATRLPGDHTRFQALARWAAERQS
jgi:geranylgeranyl diphosphate synthase, type II